MKMRAAFRHACRTKAIVCFNGRPFPVSLLDISTTGAKLMSEQPLPEPGHAVLVNRALHFERPFEFVWRKGRQAGLRFLTPLTDADLAYMRQLKPNQRSWGTQHSFRELR